MSRRQQVKSILKVALALATFWLVGSVAYHTWSRGARVAEARVASEAEARQVIRTVDERLGRLVPIGTQLAKELAELPADGLLVSLKRIIDGNLELNQVGVAFAPFAFDPAQKFFAPYYVRRGGEVVIEHVQDAVDYTVESEATRWYHRTMREGAGWSEPYYDPPTEAVLAEYVVPIVRGGKPVGVVYVNYALTTLADIVAATELGRTGYGIITSSKGALAYHPNRHLVIEGRTLADLAGELEHAGLQRLGQAMGTSQPGAMSLDDPLTGRAAWVVFEPLHSTRWTMAAIVGVDAVMQDADEVRRFKLRTMLALALVIGLAAALFLGIVDHREETWRSWILSGVVALTMSSGIFIAIIAHIGMRGNIGAADLVYLEWFFILTYLALLGLAVSALAANVLRAKEAEKKAAEAKAKAAAEPPKAEPPPVETADKPEKAEKAEKSDKGDKKGEKDKPEPPRSQKLVKLLYLPLLTFALLVVTLTYFY